MSARRLLVVAAVALGACLDSGGPPRPGTLTVALRSPHGDEGAAVLFFPGEDLSDVRSGSDVEAYASAAPDGTRVVLVSRAGGTLSFDVRVSDVERLPVGVVREVAGPDDALRTDVSGYALEISR